MGRGARLLNQRYLNSVGHDELERRLQAADDRAFGAVADLVAWHAVRHVADGLHLIERALGGRGTARRWIEHGAKANAVDFQRLGSRRMSRRARAVERRDLGTEGEKRRR